MASAHLHPDQPSLTDRLRQRIQAEGPIPFADFMEAALYDEAEGFYASARVGGEGDFVTSPSVSPVFGSLVARQVEEFWELLDRPVPFSVVELGAGHGALAREVLAGLSPSVRSDLEYTAVERSLEGRKALSSPDVRVAEGLAEVGSGLVGCVLANELLDNLPFHRLRGTEEGPVELFVGVAGSEFILVEGPPSSKDLVRLAPDLQPGEERPVSPAALALLDQAITCLRRGYIWVVDYGFVQESSPRSVHGYRRHRLEEDVLADPGSRDITSGVDFARLARHARDRGLTVWGPVSQRDALLALGFGDWDRMARKRQAEAISARRGVEALRIYSDRARANLLLRRGGLGDFFVLCLGVGVGRAPMSVARRDS
ncbi:MAG: class I SAM-dependent methyltransferase [Actinomycetota bacterium]